MSILSTISAWIDHLNERVGRFIAWAALFMVLMQFIVVILRYVFDWGSIPMQESIWYSHGILFMVAAGYTLLYDGHVRVDIVYRDARPRIKAWIDLLGTIFFLLPVCVVGWMVSWGYVLNSWKVHEGSTEASGLPTIYLLKTVILIFLLLLGLQGISLAIKSLKVVLGADSQVSTSHS